MALTNLFALIPAAPGYVGTFDAAVIFACNSLDASGSDALAYLVMLRFVLFVPITVVGLALPRLALRRLVALPGRPAERLVRVRDFARRHPTALGAVALVALVCVSLFVRTRDLHGPFWIDEGLSVGIASYPLSDIPGVLVQDGSPPLYYMLLHVWIALFGSGVEATHAFSILFALAAIPAALWAGWSLFGRRAGWAAAALAAFNPYLTIYAQETRMYAFLSFLSILTAAAFLHAFAFRRRGYLPVFAGLLIVMVYTHNWALFFTAGALVAFALDPEDVERPARASEGRRARVRRRRDRVPALASDPDLAGAAHRRAVVEQAGLRAARGGVPGRAERPGRGGRDRPRRRRRADRARPTGQVLPGAHGHPRVVHARGRDAHDRVDLVPVRARLGEPLPRRARRPGAPPRRGARPPRRDASAWSRSASCSSSGSRSSPAGVKSNADVLGELYKDQIRPGDLVVSTQPEQVPVLAYYLGRDHE